MLNNRWQISRAEGCVSPRLLNSQQDLLLHEMQFGPDSDLKDLEGGNSISNMNSVQGYVACEGAFGNAVQQKDERNYEHDHVSKGRHEVVSFVLHMNRMHIQLRFV